MRTVKTAVDSWSGFKVQKIVKITVGDVNFTSSCKNALKNCRRLGWFFLQKTVQNNIVFGWYRCKLYRCTHSVKTQGLFSIAKNSYRGRCTYFYYRNLGNTTKNCCKPMRLWWSTAAKTTVDAILTFNAKFYESHRGCCELQWQKNREDYRGCSANLFGKIV